MSTDMHKKTILVGARYALVAALALPSLCAVVGLAEAAKAEVKKGPLEEVNEAYLKAQRPAPKAGEPAGGVIALSQNDCKSFAKDFIKAGEREKREADGIFSAGVVYDHCGMIKDAEDHYRRALSKNPKHLQAMNNLGVIAKNAGRVSEAQQQFEQVLKTDARSPASVTAYNNKAVLIYERARQQGGGAGAYDEAISQLQRALAVDSESMFAYNMLATIFLQTAESDRSKLKLAELVTDNALKINPDYPQIYLTRGLIKLRAQNVSGALAEFRKAVGLDPGLVDAQMNIAAISLSVRAYQQAEGAFQQVLKKEPNNLDANIGMGVAVRGQKRYDEAETWYKKAGSLDPKNCAISYNMGILYQDYKGGEDNMKKAQDFFNKFSQCTGRDTDAVKDAKRRVKDIDDTFKAMEEQRKLEAELKKMQELERQQQGAAPPPAEPAK